MRTFLLVFFIIIIFFLGGGVSAQHFSAPLRKPKAPQCPPTEKKILATPLLLSVYMALTGSATYTP